MKTTGQILRENRERKGISVNEVAIATKINVKTIVAMEAGDTENLPPKTFLRGFVKAYATYLELDVETIMNTFFEEVGSTKPKPPEQIPTTPRANSAEAERAINPKTSPAVTIGAVVGIIVLVLLIVLVKNKMESYEKESVPGTPPAGLEALPGASASPGATPTSGAVAVSPSPSAAPAAGLGLSAIATGTATATPSLSSAVGLTPTSPAPSATATAAAAPSVSPKPVATATPAPTPAPTATAKPSPTPTATPKPSPTAKPSATPVAAAASEAAQSPTPTPKPVKANEILIEALNDVTIDATIDGEKKSMTLTAGSVQNIRAKKVTLSLSDAGAVNLTVNGNDRGVPGDLGKPNELLSRNETSLEALVGRVGDKSRHRDLAPVCKR